MEYKRYNIILKLYVVKISKNKNKNQKIIKIRTSN